MTQTIDSCPPDAGTVEKVLGGATTTRIPCWGRTPHPDGTVVRVLRPHADDVRASPPTVRSTVW